MNQRILTIVALSAVLTSTSVVDASGGRGREFITQVGVGGRVNPYAADTFNLERRLLVTSDLGVAWNLTSTFGLGVVHAFGIDNGGESRGGVKVLVRRSAGSAWSLDVAPGILLWDTRAAARIPGLTCSVDLNLKRWFSVTARFDVTPTDFDGGTDGAVYLGIGIGGAPGLAATGIGAAAGAVVGAIVAIQGAD